MPSAIKEAIILGDTFGAAEAVPFQSVNFHH
jgi:hypothetical protein